MWNPVHPDRPPPMVLRRLPPNRLAPTTSRTPTRPPCPRYHRVRMPRLRHPLPRPATLQRLQHVVSTHRPRRLMPPLRRTRRHHRPNRPKPVQPDTLKMITNTNPPTTPNSGLKPNRNRREESETPQVDVRTGSGRYPRPHRPRRTTNIRVEGHHHSLGEHRNAPMAGRDPPHSGKNGR